MLRFRCTLLLVALPLLAQRAVPVENEFVRVVSVVDKHVDKPGSVHEHQQNRVMIYLDTGEINIRYAKPDAIHKDEDQHWKAGDVAWSAAGGMHTSQHVSAAPTRIVEIELRKNTGKNAGPAPKDGILENGQVRVYRGSTAPAAGLDFIAVDLRSAETLWNRLPAGTGPFIITLLK